MKICSYNINSIRARKELLFKWLEKREFDLDILCLQELKAEEKDFPFEQFAARGYEAAVFGQPRYNGVAVCAKNGLSEIRQGFGDPEWDDQKRIISCRVNGIAVINAYMPHGSERGGDKYNYKLKWYARFLDYLEQQCDPGESLLVVGDFNVALEDRDVYDPELLHDVIGTMPEEREALRGLLDWGLVDAYRHLHPDSAGYTWWSYMGGGIWKDEGMRIDYILCTKPLLEKLVSAEVDLWPRRRRKPTPSDHAPLIAEFGD